jgi:SAM-dependent methyltransferase
MHPSALRHGKAFFDKYGPFQYIAEIGSMEVCGGSLRSVVHDYSSYIGIDCEAGPGVDYVTDDPYIIPLGSQYFDAVVSSSTFEHVEFFWQTFVEMTRLCKTNGYIYVNAPSNGFAHRFPVDCWRFYPDAGQALANWAKRDGYNVEVVETFIGPPDEDDPQRWEDWVTIWRKL